MSHGAPFAPRRWTGRDQSGWTDAVFTLLPTHSRRRSVCAGRRNGGDRHHRAQRAQARDIGSGSVARDHVNRLAPASIWGRRRSCHERAGHRALGARHLRARGDGDPGVHAPDTAMKKPLILAIEADRRQAARITTLARTELEVDLVIADSTELALEAIAE